MSALIRALRRWLTPLDDPRGVARRLERERPQPARGFERTARRGLAAQWTAAARPPSWRLQVVAVILAGLIFLIAALVVAAS
jgi:hypothetical protein